MKLHGFHHVAVSCVDENEVERVKNFYCDVLGLTLVRSWENGVMIDTGAGDYLEVLRGAACPLPQGNFRHIALRTDDPDACVAACRAAGYTVKMEPTDIVIGSSPALPARIAFVFGPLGEEVEFFCEK